MPEELESVIVRSRVHWDRSKEQIWLDLEKRLPENAEAKTVTIQKNWTRIALAAGIALLLSLTAVIKFYKKTIEIPVGQHAEVYLPDNSLVKLNAQSVISFNPLSWRFSRKLVFEGEAYFEVTKGSKFEITSDKGKTVVLGTSFNIYARDSEYKVTCFTGKVKVIGKATSSEVVLSPGQQASLNSDDIIDVQEVPDREQIISWIDNRFSFTSAPLKMVFEEIELQYGVKISVPVDLDNIYTGTFMKDSDIENTLNLVCRPFDLNAVKKSDKQYVITRNDR